MSAKKAIRKSRQKFTFSPHLVLELTEKGQVEALLADEGTVMTADLWFLHLIGDLHSSEGFTEQDFRGALAKLGKREIAQLAFSKFLATNILVPWSKEDNSANPVLSWREAGWETARLFHQATVYASFLQGSPEGWQQQLQQCEMIARGGDGPPVVKSYQGRNHIPLDDPSANRRGFFHVLNNRRTCRKFSSTRKLTKAQFSTILHYAARAQTTVQDFNLGPHILRTSPSGGARHPVEIYPQLFRVDGLPQGSFYYNPQTHALTSLGNTSEELFHRMGQQQSGCRNMPVGFLITARFARNLWKYRYAKSYAFTLFDVGHFVQTLVLCCEAVGLKCFLTPALDVSLAQEHLGLPNVYDECSTYLVTAG